MYGKDDMLNDYIKTFVESKTFALSYISTRGYPYVTSDRDKKMIIRTESLLFIALISFITQNYYNWINLDKD